MVILLKATFFGVFLVPQFNNCNVTKRTTKHIADYHKHKMIILYYDQNMSCQ